MSFLLRRRRRRVISSLNLSCGVRVWVCGTREEKLLNEKPTTKLLSVGNVQICIYSVNSFSPFSYYFHFSSSFIRVSITHTQTRPKSRRALLAILLLKFFFSSLFFFWFANLPNICSLYYYLPIFFLPLTHRPHQSKLSSPSHYPVSAKRQRRVAALPMFGCWQTRHLDD